MALTDLRGNPLGTNSGPARDAVERALWRMMSFYDTPLADLDAAIRVALQQALATAPDFVATRLNLADVLRAQRQEAQALQVLEDAARAQSGSAAVWYALGLARHRAGQSASALQALQKATRLEPRQPAYAYAYELARKADRERRQAPVR